MKLHDNVTQTLYTLTLHLATSEQTEELPEAVKAALHDPRAEIAKALHEVRMLSTTPSESVPHPDLPSALQTLFQQARASGLTAELRVGAAPGRVDSASVPEVLAVAREAVANVLTTRVGGNGLRNMRVRAATPLGAQLSIRSRPWRGTEVCLALPPPTAT
jgi:nitrate/nitrite-specific signal transduction histidine kinase